MVDEFISTLIKTNRSHLFYVDWQKARNYQSAYKDELALLHVLSDSPDPQNELKRLIKTYPKINTLIPLLLATRIADKNKQKLVVLDDDNITNIDYNFSSEGLSEADISNSVSFAEKTGLLKELTGINEHSDYYFGVEVGMDTNARKNRSGDAMELLVEDYIRKITDKHGAYYLRQTNFTKAAKIFGVEAPLHQADKKGDFMVFINSRPFNVEVNYFDGSGSKQEIMNSYIPRAEDIKKSGWGFVLVTDGPGWAEARNQLNEGFSRIRAICNIKMCQDGVLEGYLTS
jgi:type II restriction enzyme